MHKENKDKNEQQKNTTIPPEILDQWNALSDVWHELLGHRGYEKLLSTFPSDVPIPTLEVDPWSALLQANGVEVVDLQSIHLQISDQEVEQLLQVMPEEERACKETGSNN